MAEDVGRILRAAVQAALDDKDKLRPDRGKSATRGVVAGAALGVLAPLAAKGATTLVRRKVGERLLNVPSPREKVSEVGSKATEKVREKMGGKDSDGSGPSGLVGGLFSGTSEGGDEREEAGDGSTAGTGAGRRMPVQQAVDVAVPLETAYNQWTQFEDWPRFMHRLEKVEQVDDTTVAFTTKIWGVSKGFEAEIVEQRPDERIMWEVASGVTHTGVVTFHRLSDRLTRIELTLDVEPEGLIEKTARGMRFVKRAVRADLHRFKAFIELNEEETGSWRGVIEDGEVVQSPEDYEASQEEEERDRDEERPSAEADEYDEDEDEDDYEDDEYEDEPRGAEDYDEEDEAEEEEPAAEEEKSARARTQRFQKQAESAPRAARPPRSPASTTKARKSPARPSRPRTPAGS